MTPNDKTKEIIDMLNALNEYLLSLPDDMLLDVDPRDNESLEQGVKFIQAFNDNSAQFFRAADKIEQQLKQFFDIDPEAEDVERETTDDQQMTRIIKELDKTEPHSLDESFTYKRPFGFVLGKAAYKGIKTWRSLYVQVLNELYSINPQRFMQLLQAEQFVSRRGNHSFADKPDGFRFAVNLQPGFYAEGNLSANGIRDNIKDLLSYFGLNYQEMKVYFREDRDAAD